MSKNIKFLTGVLMAFAIAAVPFGMAFAITGNEYNVTVGLKDEYVCGSDSRDYVVTVTKIASYGNAFRIAQISVDGVTKYSSGNTDSASFEAVSTSANDLISAIGNKILVTPQNPNPGQAGPANMVNPANVVSLVDEDALAQACPSGDNQVPDLKPAPTGIY
jgi:hypothetical protein